MKTITPRHLQDDVWFEQIIARVHHANVAFAATNIHKLNHKLAMTVIDSTHLCLRIVVTPPQRLAFRIMLQSQWRPCRVCLAWTVRSTSASACSCAKCWLQSVGRKRLSRAAQAGHGEQYPARRRRATSHCGGRFAKRLGTHGSGSNYTNSRHARALCTATVRNPRAHARPVGELYLYVS